MALLIQTSVPLHTNLVWPLSRQCGRRRLFGGKKVILPHGKSAMRYAQAISERQVLQTFRVKQLAVRVVVNQNKKCLSFTSYQKSEHRTQRSFSPLPSRIRGMAFSTRDFRVLDCLA